MIKHIVFDFGGVLLDLDGVHTGYPDNLAVIFDVPVERAKQIWDEHKTGVITGKETPKAFLQRMKEELGYTFDVEAGLAYWEEKNIIVQERIDWKLIEAIEKLRESYQVHMLTDQIQLKNGASAWIDRVETHFDTVLRSYEQGYRKPFPEAYQNLLVKIGATQDPRSVVFIDDSKPNIDAAETADIHGIFYTFKQHDLLTNALKKLGVDVQL